MTENKTDQEKIGIKVVDRHGEYQAMLAKDSGVWESGKLRAEAIGKLIMANPDIFNIEIES